MVVIAPQQGVMLRIYTRSSAGQETPYPEIVETGVQIVVLKDHIPSRYRGKTRRNFLEYLKLNVVVIEMYNIK